MVICEGSFNNRNRSSEFAEEFLFIAEGRCGIDPETSLPDVLWKTDLQLDHGLGVETCREICLADLSVYNMTLVAINAHSGLCECVTQCDRIYTDVHWKTMVFNESIPYFSFEKSTICHLVNACISSLLLNEI